MARSNTVFTPIAVEASRRNQSPRCCLQVVSYCANWQTRWRYKHIPGPPPSFPLGNLKTIIQKEVFRAHQDWSAQYGDICKVFMVRKPVIVVTGKVCFLPSFLHCHAIAQRQHFVDAHIPAELKLFSTRINRHASIIVSTHARLTIICEGALKKQQATVHD